MIYRPKDSTQEREAANTPTSQGKFEFICFRGPKRIAPFVVQTGADIRDDPCYPHDKIILVPNGGRLGNQMSKYATLLGIAACTGHPAGITQV